MERFLNLNTKDTARALVRLNKDITEIPELNKLESIVQAIDTFQTLNPKAEFMDTATIPGTWIVTTAVKNKLEDFIYWGYAITIDPAYPLNQPPIAGIPYTTTWVKITRITWGMGDSDRIIIAKANLPRTSLAAVAADTELSMVMRSNGSYIVSGMIVYSANTVGAFKYRIGGPAGATFVDILCKHTAMGLSTLIINPVNALNAAGLAVVSASTGNGVLEFAGVIHNGANAGQLSFDWSQNVSSGNPTTRYKGSWLRLLEI